MLHHKQPLWWCSVFRLNLLFFQTSQLGAYPFSVDKNSRKRISESISESNSTAGDMNYAANTDCGVPDWTGKYRSRSLATYSASNPKVSLIATLIKNAEEAQFHYSDKSQYRVYSRLRKRRFLSKIKSKMNRLKETGLAKMSWKFSSSEAKELFDKYYNCLERKATALRAEEFPIKAILTLEGARVTMDCDVCYRPDEEADLQKANWQFLHHEGSALTNVHKSKNRKFTKDNSLIIESVDANDAGQYFCVEKEDYAAVYQLDVVATDRTAYVRFGLDPLQEDTLLFSRNLLVFTAWAPWGECNACDRLGQRSRFGQCMVKKIYPDLPVFPRDYPLMALYPYGMPCHSTAVPHHMRHAPSIGMRPSEILTSPCAPACPTPQTFAAVTDESGKLLQLLEPDIQPLDEKPKLPPLIKRKVLYEPEGSHLVLDCPGKDSPDTVRWARGEREVDPALIKRQTSGRVWVDPLNRLHIHPLVISDTAVYSCWVKTRKAATIKVITVDKANQDIKLYISYGGLALTVVGSILFVCCVCCKKSDKNAQ